jgi:hypothetical protein
MTTRNVLIAAAVSALLLGALAFGFSAPDAEGEPARCGPHQVNPEQFIAEHDADGNGTLSQDEFPGPDRAFDHVDANDDGQITAEEAGQAAKMRRARRGGQGGPGHGPMDPAERWEKMLEHLDADGSGTISQDEFPGRDEVFEKIDADGNGEITQEEAADARPRRGHRGGPGHGGPRGPQA